MVLSQIASQINPFGGFAPFPNSIMVPVMGLQSDVIGYKFGFGYEMGKRTVRAMSNDQFNGLTGAEIKNIQDSYTNDAVTRFQSELPNFTNLQSEIIDHSVEIEKMKANRTPSALAEIITALNEGAYTLPLDAISNFVASSTSLTEAINSLSAISPFLGLMGLKQQGTGETEEPVPSTGQKLFNWKSFTAANSNPTSYCTSFDSVYEFTYDTTKVEELKTTLEGIMNAEEAKYPGQFHNRTDWTFCSTDSAFIASAVKYVRALDKWWFIHDGTTNKSLPTLDPNNYSL